MPEAPFAKIAAEIGQLLEKKNAAYGSAFAKAATFLQILYPNGIEPNQYSNVLLLVRIFDKMVRIATDQDALGEDPFMDIAGYGILGVSLRLPSASPSSPPQQGPEVSKCGGCGTTFSFSKPESEEHL
jgi:hypothetical protein